MQWVTVAGVRLEYQRIGALDPSRPTIVMLHEGLGSVSIWKEFPARLHEVTGCPILVYSREGYGGSDRRREALGVRYMHREGLEVLPALLDALGITSPLLFGHSDGGSIALICAGGTDRKLAGVIALAPHVMVEDLSVRSIAAARTLYQTTDLRARLARYHADVDGVFWGWNDIWLSEAFRHWNIEEYLPRIACPILIIQGEDDEYGTMEQIDRIKAQARNVTILKLPDCRHSPHRDQTERVLEAVADWLTQFAHSTLGRCRARPTP